MACNLRGRMIWGEIMAWILHIFKGLLLFENVCNVEIMLFFSL